MLRYLLLPSLCFLLVVGSPSSADPPAAKKRLLLLAQGPDGHPPQTHEYEAGLKILQKLLTKAEGLDVTLVRADEPWREGPELLAKADGVVLFLSEGAKWLHQDPKRLEALAALARRGGGISALHWAMGTKDAANIDGFVKLAGGCHGGPDRKYKVVTAEATVPDPKHPVVAGLAAFKVRDEFYYHLKFPKDKLGAGWSPILQVEIDGNKETVAWAWDRPDKGRSFGFSGLHFHENWQVPEYRRLVTQGVLWTMRTPFPGAGYGADAR